MLTKFIKKSTALLVLSLFAGVVSAQSESSLVAGKYGEVEGQKVQSVKCRQSGRCVVDCISA